jgi:hypothetical protein
VQPPPSCYLFALPPRVHILTLCPVTGRWEASRP